MMLLALPSSAKLAMPSLSHPLGTDVLGRDIAVRLMTGAQTTLLVVLTAVLVSCAIALCLSLTLVSAPGTHGWLRSALHGAHAALLRVADTLRAIPRVVLVIALAGFLARGAGSAGADDTGALWRLAILLGVTGWMPLMRLLNDLILDARTEPHLQAAQALGVPPWRRFWAHEAPAIWPLLAVWLTASVADLIVLEAGLSYLGVGVPVTMASWGTVLRDVGDVFGSARWLMLGPGMVIGGTVVALQWAADRLGGRTVTKRYTV